jgi:hypothetical protein
MQMFAYKGKIYSNNQFYSEGMPRLTPLYGAAPGVGNCSYKVALPLCSHINDLQRSNIRAGDFTNQQ